jgi:heme oxygenase
MSAFEQQAHERLLDGLLVPEASAVDLDPAGRHNCSMNIGSRLPAASQNRPLSELLRERTASVHTEAERTGIIADILQRKADRSGYALFLRNILPAYESLESELSRRSADPILGVFSRHTLWRSDRLRNDLLHIEGAGWEQSLPLLASGVSYADCIARAGGGDGLRLSSHAYVRYFGDLSGGQILKKLLGKTLSLPAEALTLYDFPGLDAQALKAEMRDALNHAGRVSDDEDSLVAEAIAAFEHNIGVSREVQNLVGATVVASI